MPPLVLAMPCNIFARQGTKISHEHDLKMTGYALTLPASALGCGLRESEFLSRYDQPRARTYLQQHGNSFARRLSHVGFAVCVSPAGEAEFFIAQEVTGWRWTL
jgi:hypothetical protein